MQEMFLNVNTGELIESTDLKKVFVATSTSEEKIFNNKKIRTFENKTEAEFYEYLGLSFDEFKNKFNIKNELSFPFGLIDEKLTISNFFIQQDTKHKLKNEFYLRYFTNNYKSITFIIKLIDDEIILLLDFYDECFFIDKNKKKRFINFFNSLNIFYKDILKFQK